MRKLVCHVFYRIRFSSQTLYKSGVHKKRFASFHRLSHVTRWNVTFDFYWQFNRYKPEEGKITERDFASMMLTYAGFPDKKKALMIRRVKKAYKDSDKAMVP